MIPSASYFEKRRQEFMNEPFKNAQERFEFQLPLNQWGKYCEATLQERRGKYHVNRAVITVAEALFKSVGQGQVRRSDGQPVQIVLWRGGVDHIEADAAVNAANETLLGGGGVDKAVHDAAGHLLVKECAFLNGCEVGEAKITKGYDMPAKYVLHTVGPILNDDGTPNPEALASCYRSCLKLSEENGLTSVVFPCISTGYYGFPIDLSAKVALETTTEYMKTKGKCLKTIIFALFEEAQVKAYKNSIFEVVTS